ncbi:MAG TPA: pyridoxamine 5'-phosphate oxidase family protein, partial [Magnetovibrio sp.]
MKDAPAVFAREARLIARGAVSGALATFRRSARGSTQDGGQPYVSKVGVALDPAGRPIFLFSTLAAHTQDLLADERCSVLVEAPVSGANPLQAGRATLV